MRKNDGGLRALSDWLGDDKSKDFLVDNTFGLADIAAGSLLGFAEFKLPEHPLPKPNPNLLRYSDRLEKRKSFVDSAPQPPTFREVYLGDRGRCVLTILCPSTVE